MKSKVELCLLVWMPPTSTYTLVYSKNINKNPFKNNTKVACDMTLNLVCSKQWYCKTTVHAKILRY